MYSQLSEEIEKTPASVKALLCMAATTTILILIMFIMMIVYLSDLNTLIHDGAQTIRDLNVILPDIQQIIPQVKNSVVILKKICNKNTDLC